MFSRTFLRSVSSDPITRIASTALPTSYAIADHWCVFFPQNFARQAVRPAARPIAFRAPLPFLTQHRLISDETKQAIENAVGSAPVVLFMKGTPETPQCGFSRASIQILGLQGVDPSKFAAFNVLADPELRQGMSIRSVQQLKTRAGLEVFPIGKERNADSFCVCVCVNRYQGVL